MLEAFGCPGINLEETRWTHLNLVTDRGKTISQPDLADIIYHIFRCSDAHAQEIPVEYELLPKNGNNYVLGIDFVKQTLQLPESIVFALIAISVFSSANSHIKTNGSHSLNWTSQNGQFHEFPIKDWWGRESDVKAVIAKDPPIRVKLEGL